MPRRRPVSAAAAMYLLSTTDRRRTGVASRCTIVPSSISAPSTLVPMMSAVSGSTTVKPNTPRNSGGQTGLRAVSFSSAETPIRMTGAIAKMRARLRPMVARTVSRRITPFTAPEATLRPAR